MSLRRIWVLFKKELGKSATNFFFVIAVVVPLVLTLLVTLVFGDLFSSTPRLSAWCGEAIGHIRDSPSIGSLTMRCCSISSPNGRLTRPTATASWSRTRRRFMDFRRRVDAGLARVSSQRFRVARDRRDLRLGFMAGRC